MGEFACTQRARGNGANWHQAHTSEAKTHRSAPLDQKCIRMQWGGCQVSARERVSSSNSRNKTHPPLGAPGGPGQGQMCLCACAYNYMF